MPHSITQAITQAIALKPICPKRVRTTTTSAQRVTSVPTWDGGGRVDPAGRRIALVGVGAAGAALASEWVDQLALGQQHWLRSADVVTPQLLAELDAELAAAQVGWRLMVAGPDSVLSWLRGRALAAGAEPSEIQAVLTDVSSRTVYCVHCRRSFDTSVEVGGETGCTGCGRTLRIRPHFSPRLGAYLGAAEPELPR